MKVIGQQGQHRWLIQRGNGTAKYESSCIIVDEKQRQSWSVLYGSALRRGVWERPTQSPSARKLAALYPIGS